ncbi:hypothetical protein P7H62_14480 [Vagococcus carniphilus]|uniref:hypothetical protein n=1 Tax=Vagococcus carniphilus TaxID=218144 RepID=UPI00289124A6|nr:hypothetical protein [Vagococcus carniphilus]MDT2832286.1 hypothetical protein [Vagococcus carniphilus]MDT2840719.1 hypothetical protein [Vagococcus carniphilus]MDT2855669.1 hypothetical protein [Vagococcus carniphilus]
MSVFDDLEEQKVNLKGLSDDLDKVINNLESVDNDMEIREAMEIVENAISELKGINSDIY